MRWVRWTLIVTSIIVVLVGAAIVTLLTIDLSRFKGNFESVVSEATGREFVIAGAFEPSIGSTVDLLAEGVRLANADWGLAENVLELERVIVRIDTWSLVSGPIDILNLEIEGLTVHVEKEPETLRSSWSFGEADASADRAERGFELPLWLREARLERISVTYGQGWMDTPRNITVSDARLSADERDQLNMVLSGAIGAEPIRAEGLIGPLAALIDGQGPRWSLDVKIGDFLASTQGTFRDWSTLDGPEIHAVMQGPLAERILARFGLPPLARGAVDITADLTEGSDGIDLRIAGAFGDLTADVVGHADSLKTIRNLDLSVDVRGPDIQAIGSLFAVEALPPTGFTIQGDVAVRRDVLRLESIVASVGDARLETSGTLAPATADPDARLRITVTGPEVHEFLPAELAERIPAGAFEIRALAAGGLRRPVLQNVTAKLGQHELSAEGILPAAADMAGLDIAVSVGGPDLDELVGLWADRDLLAEPYSANAQIHNDGTGFAVDDLTFELPSASGALSGTSGTLPTLDGLDATIEVGGEDLQALIEPWLDVLLPAVPFGFEGRFVESDGAVQMSNVRYRLGEARGEMNGTTGALPTLDGLRLDTSLRGPDISRFAEVLGGTEVPAPLPAAAFETRGAISKTGDIWFVTPWTVRIGDFRMELNGALGSLTGAGGIDLVVAASGADLRRFLPDRGIESDVPFEIGGGVRVGDTVIELEDIDVRLGETTAFLDGRLPTDPESRDADLVVRIAGPDLRRAGDLFNVRELPPDAFRFEGALSRSAEAFAISDLIAVVGENDLTGSLSLMTGPKARVSGRLESENLNLTRLLARREDDAAVEEQRETRDRVIPDTPLPLRMLDVADVDVTIRLRKLETENLRVGDVEFVLIVDNEKLHVDTGRVSLRNGGTMKATLDVVRTDVELADVELSVIGEQFRLRPAFDRDGNPINRPPEDLRLELTGTGRTIRELAASANGSISLRQGEGDIENDFGGYLMRDVSAQIFAAINPLVEESNYTRLNCGFFDVQVIDGIVRSRAIGLQTDKLAVASIGSLNLATEALDLSFRVKQREGIGISLAGVINPYVKVGGTLSSPALEMDKRRGLLSGAVAALTGGLSILAQGVWDRYLSRDDYCQAVIDALEAGELPVWEGE